MKPKAFARRLLCCLLTLPSAACVFPPEPACHMPVDVLVYNIRHGLGSDSRLDLLRVADYVVEQDADILVLQEVDENCHRSGNVDQARVLGELCGMQSVFSSFMDYDGGRYGMAVLSRLPIQGQRNIRLPDGTEPRTCLAIQVEVGSRPLWIAGIHLYQTEVERLAQARCLIENFAGSEVPVTLAGDFNSEPDSAVMELLAQHWRIAPKQGERATFPAIAPEREIDYVLLPQVDWLMAEQHCVLPEATVSDHRPLRIVLRAAP